MDGEMKGEYRKDEVVNRPGGEDWQSRWQINVRGKYKRAQHHVCDLNMGIHQKWAFFSACPQQKILNKEPVLWEQIWLFWLYSGFLDLSLLFFFLDPIIC